MSPGRRIPFAKMHGAGNDFVVIDCLAGDPVAHWEDFARRALDRRFGIGGDQLLLVQPSERADAFMGIRNPDGSVAEMCANGIRAFFKYLRDHRLIEGDQATVETLAGIVTPRWLGDDRVEVEMTPPVLDPARIPTTLSGSPPLVDVPIEVDGQTLRVTPVSMGNPHCVVFVDDPEKTAVELLGPKLENHPAFPQRANIEFVAVRSRGELEQRTWERGAGETLACGSGACATCVAGVLSGRTDRDVKIRLRGGELRLRWPENDGPVWLTGPAAHVFDGGVDALMRLEGTYTALVTPFRADGTIDLDALSTIVEWQIESGIDGLVPCGSTGESATLTPAEHVQVVRHVIQVAGGRVPIIAGTGSNNTREAVEFTAEAREAGADAALLISPYYNKPTQDGIYYHYRTIAEETGMPLVVYNIPGRTGSRIAPETLGRLSRVDGVVGLKESGGDLFLSSETLAQVDPEFSIVSGDDALTLPLLALGGRGAISVTSNIAPVEMAQITRAFLAGDPEAAREAHYRLLPVMQALFIESNPIPIKAAMQILGRISHATVRLPLTEMQKENRDRLEATLEGIPRA